MRHISCIAAFAALLLAASVAQAGTVTTNGYDANSTSSNIDKSCKELDFTTTGALKGNCNTGGENTKSTQLDLTSYAGCDGGTLKWGTGLGLVSPSSSYLAGADIEVSSNGQSYLLSGTCSTSSGATDTGVDTLKLSDRVTNSKGDFKYTTSR